ncbi:uncharacterized protein LOC125552440 isoform X2 [Triticum urartu]|uniref:uncharacterized protein LOC125552306 isoform X2 n=1 Tax=Triticum urartu TaxID=4572 RepID=UPI002043CD38|nr:uncharacterized protein LOC125552306 isoform X2 [Triticum urartu]XP_048572078.1 uncharacterized protein LOC125552440 isoform X2 [Triticum urartu]
MLNFMEYWTTDVLTDQFTQEDIKHFRRKLVVILLDSELNKLKRCPIYHQPDIKENVSKSDLELLDNPPDGVKDRRPSPILSMPTDQFELLVGLCNYIMSIDDAKCLEKEWDRSSTPRPMGLSLKKLQSILNMKQSMDNDFSTLLCVFWHVTREYCSQTLQYTTWIYNFVPCCGIQHEIKSFCDKETIQKLATLFDSWHGRDNNILSCNMVIDKEACHVSILDPIRTTQMTEMKILKHLVKLKSFAREFKETLEIKQPGWHSDISKCQRVFPNGIPTSIDGDLSGFYVFHFMLWWNDKDLVQPVCAMSIDGYELRKRFLLYLLKHHANEVKDNLPDIVREFLKRIK